jgi:hypothetical protein
MSNLTARKLAGIGGVILLSICGGVPSVSVADTAPGFHFQSVCRSDPTSNKNQVTVVLHGPDQEISTGSYFQTHDPLAGVTINALWTYVDYRQNHAVFSYKQVSCVTADDGSCTFNGGNGRARWELTSVTGYYMSSPAFDTVPTDACPNTLMIDFW